MRLAPSVSRCPLDARIWWRGSCESGAVSLLFISAGLPFLLMLLVVGMEISQFLGAREALQGIVDQEAHASLQHGYTNDQVARRVTSRLGARASQINVTQVVASGVRGSSSVSVVGSFRGVVSEIFGGLVGTKGGGIAFEVSGAARRARLGALVVLDRGTPLEVARCADTHLALRGDFVARLAQSLRDSGARSVSIGVVPGVGEDAITMLKGSSDVDGVSRCSESGEGDPDRVRGVAAVADPTTGSVDLAYGVLKSFSTVVNEEEVETGSLIMISSANNSRTEGSVSTISLLESSIGEFGKPIVAVALAEGVLAGDDPFPLHPGAASGLGRYISATDTDIQRPELVSAIAGHIHGATFLSR